MFDRYYNKYDAWYEKNKFAYLSELAVLKKLVPINKKGLEIGVGTGRFAAPLGISIGVDPSHRMLDIARERGVNVRWGSGEDLQFLDNTFDYILIMITICFVKDPLRVLQEARRVLKNEGQLLMGIIDKNSFLGKFYRQKKSIFYHKAHFFSVEELTQLLKKAGFNKFSYCQTLFELPERIKDIEKPLRGFGKGGFVLIKARKSKGGVV